MDEIDLGCEAGEERCFFASGVAATDDANGHISVEGTVAGGAGGESVSDEFLFSGEAEPFGTGAGGNDQGLGFDPFSVDLEADGVAGVFEGFDGSELEAGAEAGGLGFDVHDEVGSLDAFGEAWEVLDERGGGELSAGFVAFEDEGGEVCAGGVHCGGETGAA